MVESWAHVCVPRARGLRSGKNLLKSPFGPRRNAAELDTKHEWLFALVLYLACILFPVLAGPKPCIPCVILPFKQQKSDYGTNTTANGGRACKADCRA